MNPRRLILAVAAAFSIGATPVSTFLDESDSVIYCARAYSKMEEASITMGMLWPSDTQAYWYFKGRSEAFAEAAKLAREVAQDIDDKDLTKK